MATGAHVELLRVQWFGALGDTRLGVHSPLVVVGGPKPGREPHPAGLWRTIWLRLRRSRAFRLAGLGPVGVAGARAMASLAGDVDIGPAGGIAIGGEVVVLFQIRRVAARTLIVPGLVALCPMEAVAGSRGLLGVKMEPALASLLLGTAVPRDAQRLIAAAAEGNQIL